MRRRALEGMVLHGHLETLGRDRITFDDDLAANLDGADAVSCPIRRRIDAHIAARGLEAPTEAPYTPCWEPTPGIPTRELDPHCLAAVIWCTGYAADFSRVVVPICDGSGQPAHRSRLTQAPGLHRLGLSWLHTWGSGRFCGLADDATYPAEAIRLASSATPAPRCARNRPCRHAPPPPGIPDPLHGVVRDTAWKLAQPVRRPEPVSLRQRRSATRDQITLATAKGQAPPAGRRP